MNRRRRTRQSSNVFTAFTQAQILELKEVFNLLDSNSDGHISKEDLVIFLNSIGSPLTDDEINNMMEDMCGTFNFTLFLTTLCEKLSNIDSENVIVDALKIFDVEDTGYINMLEFKDALLNLGDKITIEDWMLLEKELKQEDGKISINDIAKTIRYCGLLPSDIV